VTPKQPLTETHEYVAGGMPLLHYRCASCGNVVITTPAVPDTPPPLNVTLPALCSTCHTYPPGGWTPLHDVPTFIQTR
jgi:hypothetical protein